MTDPIIIQDYDPNWPDEFERLRCHIAPSLGALAQAIEHVGSTAVRGLAAKPIIDIDVLLHSAADLPLAIFRFAILGYEHQGDLGITGREAFRAPANSVPHHLYLHGPDSQEYVRHILFRDYLRANPEAAHSYETLKRSLANQYRDDREAYSQAKTEFVESILRKAAPHLRNKILPPHV